MASRYSIEAVFRAIDQYTSPVKKMQFITKSFTYGLKEDFAKAQRQVKQFGENFVRNLGRNIVIGVGIAIAALAKLVIEANKSWDAQSAAMANVKAGLESTSYGAGRSLAQLEKQAESLMKNTFIGDESILQGVTAQLLTFTNITENRFDRAQKAVIDVSAKLDGLNVTTKTLRARSIAIGKALNAPTANLGALSRMGIQFSDSQKEIIKSLEASGKLFQAQDVILKEIERQYGGTAAALAKTAGGMELQMKNIGDDMLKLTGRAIEPLRIKFLQLAIDVLNKLLPYIEKLTIYIEKNADKIFKGFTDVLSFVWGTIKIGIKIISTLYKILKPLAPFIIGIVIAFMAYRAVLIVAAIAQGIMNIIMMANPIGLIIIAIGILIGLIIIIVANWNKIIDVLKKVWDWMVKLAKAVWDGIVNAFKAAIQWIANVGEKFTFLLGPIGFVVSALIEIGKQWDNITAKFKSGDILGGILAIGGAILSGLLAPIQGFLELVSKIPGVGDLAASGAKKIQELRLGLTGGKSGDIQAPVSSLERSTVIRQEQTSNGELTIRDQTGRAEMTKKPSGGTYKIKLQSSANFSGGAH